MQRIQLGATIAALYLMTGCKGASGDGAAAGADCTYKHQNPTFCLTPPAGFNPRTENKGSDGASYLSFNKTGFPAELALKWGGPVGIEARVNAAKVHPAASSPIKLIGDGDLPNGGYWSHTTLMNNGKLDHRVQYLVRGKVGWIECDFGTPDVAAVETLLAGCKSLKVD